MCSRIVRMSTKWPKREKHEFMKFQAPGRGGGTQQSYFSTKIHFFRRGGGKNLEYLKN